MKKSFLIFFLILSAVQTIAQVISVGIKTSYVSAGISNADDGKMPVNGVGGGIVANAGFGETFSLQLEGNYLKKGGGYGLMYGGQNYSDIYSFQVFEFPLLAKFTVGKPRTKFIANAGPYVAYVLSGQHKIENAGVNSSEKLNNFDAYDANGMKTKRFDAGIQIGTGFSIDIGKGRMFVEGRYSVGFINWFDFNATPQLSPNSPFQGINFKDIRHHVVSLNVGYTIPVWQRSKK